MLSAVFAVDNIVEQLQLGGIGNLIGISCGAEAVHVYSVIADSVEHRNAAIHRAAGHGKFAAVFNKHAVALPCRTAFDTATGHFQSAASDKHTTADHIPGRHSFHFDCAAVLNPRVVRENHGSATKYEIHSAAIYRRAVRNATAIFHGENRRIVFRDISADIYTATANAIAASDGRVFGHGKSGVIKIDTAAILCCAVLNHGISRQGNRYAGVSTDTTTTISTAFCTYAIRDEGAATHGKG